MWAAEASGPREQLAGLPEGTGAGSSGVDTRQQEGCSVTIRGTELQGEKVISREAF